MSHWYRVPSTVRIILALTLCYVWCPAMCAQNLVPYRNPSLPVEQRVADLLSRMTLDEKVAQLVGASENRQFAQNAGRPILRGPKWRI